MKTKRSRVKPPVVFLFEPDEELRNVVALMLRQTGLKVLEIAHEAVTWEMLPTDAPDLVVIDLRLHSQYLGKLIEAYRRYHNSMVIVTTTERPESNWRNSYQPDAVIYKPYDVRYLRKKVLTLLEKIVGKLQVSKNTA